MMREASIHAERAITRDLMRVGFGHHLAGLIDGEGCFVIRPNTTHPTGASWMCAFHMHLRADDRPMLEMLQREAGIGAVRVGRREVATEGRKDNPSSQWVIANRGDCFKLAAILDEHPLWSKKARDYRLWREALAAWSVQDWARMEALAGRLKQIRVFEADDSLVEIPVSQLALEVA